MRFALSISMLAVPLLAQAASTGAGHLAAAHRRHSSPPAADHHLQKRLSGFGTWYVVGLGACGWWNNENDFIVAMNEGQFPNDGYPSSICGKTLTVTGPTGNTATATVADLCPMGGGNCNYGDMDMSKGLFQAVFGDLGVGKGPITWEWGGSGGGGGGGSPPQQDPTTPPYTPPAEPTPDPPPYTPPPYTPPPYTPPPQDTPTPTPTPDPTTAPSPTPTPSPTSTSSTSQSSQSSSSSASATSTGTFNIQDVSSGSSNYDDLNKFMLQLQQTANKAYELE